MDQLNVRRFRVESWLVEPALNQISDGEKSIKLEPLTMDALVYFVRHQGEVISREELLKAVWSDCAVAENTLSRTISRLRKALGDDWQRPRYLETITKNGYRWIAPVDIPGHAGQTRAHALPSSHSPIKRSWMQRLAISLLSALTVVLLIVWWTNPVKENWTGPVSVKPAITLAGRQIAPALSPDGRYIAFAWQGDRGGNPSIYVAASDGSNPQRLIEDEQVAVLPAWSPDGRYIAYVSGSGSCGIYRVPLTGGPPVKLGTCLANTRHLNWSPDGSALAFDGRSVEDKLQTLYRLPLDGSPSERILEPLAGSDGDWQPVFSPGGQKLTFVRRLNKDLHQVMLVDLAKGKTSQLTTHDEGRIRGVDWTPDGKAVVYSFNRDGRYALWHQPLGGGKAKRLPITDDWVTYPSFARESNALIYKNYADIVNLWSIQLDEAGTPSGEPMLIAASSRSELHPRIAPTNDRLAFFSNRSGSFELWSEYGDTLLCHSQLEGKVPGLMDWSNDGQKLVYSARIKGQSDLFLVEANSSVSQTLIESTYNECNPRFAHDGPMLYYTSDQTGQWQIWTISLEDKSRRQLTQEGGYLAQADPLGNGLYFSKLNQADIFRLDLDSNEETRVWQGLGNLDWGNWQVTPGGLYYLDRSTQSLMVKPLNGEPRLVFKAAMTFPYLGPAFHISSNANRVIFGQIAHSDDEIMLATFSR